MGHIHIELFATLDLVGQAPGGPEEDPEGSFPYGGWQAPLMDEEAGAQVMAAYEDTDALLLGPDLPAAVREVRDRHQHVKVVGSLNLLQTLLREKLFDRLDL